MNLLEQSKGRTFSDIFSLAMKGYRESLRRTIAVIVMIVVIKDCYVYLGGAPTSPTAQGVGALLIGVVLIFLFAVSLQASYSSLKPSPTKLSDHFNHVLKRLIPLYLSVLFFIVLFVVIFFVVKWIVFAIGGDSVDKTRRSIEGVFIASFAGLMMLYVVIRCYFVLPMVVLDSLSAWRAFAESVRLTLNNALRTFGIYLCGVIMVVLTMPGSRHYIWLADHKLIALFDLFVFALLLPLYLNMVVLMLRDLQWRRGH